MSDSIDTINAIVESDNVVVLDLPTKNPVGRPAAVIDLAVVERAASIGCTSDEIAAMCGVARSTFLGRMADEQEIKDAVERGRAVGRATLRRMQWKGATEGNPTMLIWLGKQLLGQKDKTEVTGENGGPVLGLIAIPQKSSDAT